MSSEPRAQPRPDPLSHICDANYLPLLECGCRGSRSWGSSGSRCSVWTPDFGWCDPRCAARRLRDGNLRDLWTQRIRVFSELLAAARNSSIPTLMPSGTQSAADGLGRGAR